MNLTCGNFFSHIRGGRKNTDLACNDPPVSMRPGTSPSELSHNCKLERELEKRPEVFRHNFRHGSSKSSYERVFVYIVWSACKKVPPAWFGMRSLERAVNSYSSESKVLTSLKLEIVISGTFMKMMPGWDGDVGEAYLFLDCNHLQLINLRKE